MFVLQKMILFLNHISYVCLLRRIVKIGLGAFSQDFAKNIIIVYIRESAKQGQE